MGYTYDHAGRLETVRRDGVTIAEYAYDANGNRESLTYTGTGMVTSYAFNKANLVTSLVNRKGSDNSSQFTYTYFLDGNQATKAEPGKTTSYTYDLAGRLLQETAGAQTLAYTYDRFGNRATLTASGPEAYTTTYTYDSRNQLTRSSEVRGGVATVTDYGYDAVGNELFRARNGAVASTVDMEYNNYNQLVKVTKDGVATTYTYRPDGLRLSKTVAGVMTRHIWDGEQIIAELNSNGTTKSRFLRGVNLIAQQIDSQTQYYLFNAHGDVVQKTSSNGTVLKNYSYDAFGVESNMEALDGNPFRYCGEYFDKESDTYYLRARYYNPRTGRFGAEDPAKDGLNWYIYCGSNPVMLVDPKGLAAKPTKREQTGGWRTVKERTGELPGGRYKAQSEPLVNSFTPSMPRKGTGDYSRLITTIYALDDGEPRVEITVTRPQKPVHPGNDIKMLGWGVGVSGSVVASGSWSIPCIENPAILIFEMAGYYVRNDLTFFH